VPQLLVCLRILIRRCVYENVPVPELFPEEVSPELQKLLTLLLLKFQPEWLEDVSKDQVV
jgi:COMM domain containing 9